jgi:hypothetical protein
VNNIGPKNQNFIAESFLQGSDLNKRIGKIIKEISQETGFIADGQTQTSGWWGSKIIGAFHRHGKYQGKAAVLKVQGIKPNTSEIEMIKSFEAQNKSQIIRPPKLYATIPWSDEKRYEALIMEDVGDKKVIDAPTNSDEVKRFFRIFKEYREKCRNCPWLERPGISIGEMIKTRFEKWKKSSLEIYPDHPFRNSDDMQLIDQVIKFLVEKYSGIEWEFQHGHLSDSDLYIEANGQIAVLSNLYWSWRAPFYDAVFAYHWFIYHLADMKEITPEEIEKQRKLWLDKIYELFGKDKGLLKLALLERAIAGLNLDALSVDIKSPVASYLIERTRKNVISLMEEINEFN